MKSPSLYARHEAAHAVVAAFVGLPITEVTITSGEEDGRTIAGCVRLADVEYEPRDLIGIAVTALAARVETDRFKWTGDIPDFTYATDEKIVNRMATCLGIPNERYHDWRAILLELTASILAVPWIEDTIEAVAHLLDQNTTIPPEEVHGISQLHKYAFPTAVQDLQISDDLMARVQKLRDELDSR